MAFSRQEVPQATFERVELVCLYSCSEYTKYALPFPRPGNGGLPCLGYLCYTEKRSIATTPAIVCTTLCQHAYAFTIKGSTHHAHPPQSTSHSPAPRQLPRNEHAPCELVAPCPPCQHQKHKATNRRKKIIPDKMSAICPLFQHDQYNEHAGHTHLRQRRQVRENDQSNLSKKIRGSPSWRVISGGA